MLYESFIAYIKNMKALSFQANIRVKYKYNYRY